VTQDENITHSQSSISAPVINNTIQPRDTAAMNNNYMIVYHEKTCHYVLSEYCVPISHKPSVQVTIPCKFQYRDCLIARSKCLQTGDHLVDFSISVYHPNYDKNRKMHHTLLDAQVIKCLIPNCNTTKGGNPKQFHYSIFDTDVVDGDVIENGDVVNGFVAVCGNGNGPVTSGSMAVVSFDVVDKLTNASDSLFLSETFCFFALFFS
jgi:hypothetical protein